MLNPHYPALFPGQDRYAPWIFDRCEAVDDSGAFQERDMAGRLTPEAALRRQLDHETRIRLYHPSFRFSALVTYDMLVGVDEAYELGPDGKHHRTKRRGTVETARAAVDETKRSAALYYKRRRDIAGAIAYSAQGAEPDQYLDCVETLLGYVRPGVDWLALGGFCIIGKKPSLLPTFAETVRRAVPLAAKAGCTRVHLLGVCWPPALRILAEAAAACGIDVSTDSASIEMNSIMGRVWRAEHMTRPGRGKIPASPWLQTFAPGDKLKRGEAPRPGSYQPAHLALENIERFDRWCHQLGAELRTPSPRRWPTLPPRIVGGPLAQLGLAGV